MTRTSKRVRTRIVIPSCGLSVVEGPDLGKKREWNQRLIRIGRDDHNDLILTDPAISGCHFTLEHDPEKGGYQLIDQHSTNGVWCNQLQLIHAYLNSTVLLSVGDTVLEFFPQDRWIDKTVGIPDTDVEAEDISYQTPAQQELFARMSCLADVDIPVLFLGETGTGKSTLAQQLHQMCQRKEYPFIHVNCAAIPHHLFESEFFGYKRGAFTGAHRDHDGFFAQAHQGILFLDEIAELSLENQTKLLTALEHQHFYPLGSKEKKGVDIRLFTATNQNLYAAVQQGYFREDLYYRIAVFEFIVPSLRERPDDIQELAQHFLKTFLAKHPNKPSLTFSEGVRLFFQNYTWPGNIRELHNAVWSSATYASTRQGPPEILRQDLPAHLQRTIPPIPPIPPGLEHACHAPEPPAPPPPSGRFSYHFPFPRYEQERKQILEELQRTYLQAVLTHTGGNISKASEISGLARTYLQTLIKDLDIPRR